MRTAIVSIVLAFALATQLACGGAPPQKATVLENLQAQDSGQEDRATLSSWWSEAGQTPVARAAFALFSADTNAIIGIDLRNVVDGELGPLLTPGIQSWLDESHHAIENMKTTCGLDFLASFDTIIVGGIVGRNMAVDEKSMIIVVSGPSRATVVSCSRAITGPKGGRVVERGRFSRVFHGDGTDDWIAWLDDNTMALTDGMDETAFAARMAGTEAGRGDPEIRRLLARTEHTSGLWLVMKPEGGFDSSQVDPKMRDIALQAFYGSLDLRTGARLRAGIRTGNADQGRSLKALLDQRLAEVKPMVEMFGMGHFLDKLQLDRDGDEVSAVLTLSPEDVRVIDKMLRTAN